MLSSMQNNLAITVLAPTGTKSVRIPRISPAFYEVQKLINSSLPDGQIWEQLNELLTDPLKAIINWCARYGLDLNDKSDDLILDGCLLSKRYWLEFFKKTQAASGHPGHILTFANRMGQQGLLDRLDMTHRCLHVHKLATGGSNVNLIINLGLPSGCKAGDLIDNSSRGPTGYLTSCSSLAWSDAGEIEPVSGFVLEKSEDNPRLVFLEDILAQPMILGFNRTYRCEEGSASGWLEDMSFDSLAQARSNAKEIVASGSEARIINRLTGESVSFA